MIICGPTERSRQVSSCSVDSLPLILEIDSSCDFCDQNWGQVLGSIVFVHTEIVYFSHLDLVSLDTCQDRDAGDTCNKCLIFIPDSDKPFGLISRGRQGPSQKLSRVVESEGVVVILDVVIGQKDIQFIKFGVFLDIYLAPVQFIVGEFLGFFINVLDFSGALNVSVVDLFLVVSQHGSVVPVSVFFKDVLVVLYFTAILPII